MFTRVQYLFSVQKQKEYVFGVVSRECELSTWFWCGYLKKNSLDTHFHLTTLKILCVEWNCNQGYCNFVISKSNALITRLNTVRDTKRCAKNANSVERLD